MLLVPAQVAMATHNSFGVRGEFAIADEVDPETGEIVPDVQPGDKPDRIMNRYYEGFAEDNDVPVRHGPLDASGEFYNPDDGCTPYAEFESPDDPGLTQRDAYENALPNYDDDGFTEKREDACYVGFFDSQAEYVMALFWMEPREDSCLGLVNTGENICHKSSDPLYRFNPCDSAEQDGCDEDDENCDFGNVDHIQSDDCKDPAHRAYWPGEFGMMAIDVDFAEIAFGGNNNDRACGGGPSCEAPGLADAFKGEGDEGAQGSGTLSLPAEYTEQVFLFGYAHPDNPDPNQFTVDSEIFSQPLSGVTDNACGNAADTPAGEEPDTQRVPPGECRLLDPTDIALYDTNWPHDDGEEGRMCSLDPDAAITNPGEDDPVKPCGPLGTQFIQFDGEPAGGFGAAPVDTFQATLPGWSTGIMTLTGTAGQFGPLEHSEFFDPTVHDDQDTGGAADNYDRGIITLNPKVPTGNHDLWCVQPQILTDENAIEVDIDGDGVEESVAADGLYGDYQAHAVDLDIYAHGLNEPIEAVHDGDASPAPGYHEVADPVTDPVVNLLDDLFGTAGDLLDQAGDAVPEDLPGQDVIDETTETVNETVGDTPDRVGPTESADEEPMSGIGGYETFDKTVGTQGEFSIVCDGAGNLDLIEGESVTEGGLVYDARVSQQSAELSGERTVLKDPTILNGTLPAQEDDTTDGTWQIDAYSFGGPFLSFFDKGGDEGEFDGCDPDTGQPDPSLDDCSWLALWDAYNPGCSGEIGDDDAECDEILDHRGFDVGGPDTPAEDGTYGVGLVSTLKISGPALLLNEGGTAQDTVDSLEIVNQDPNDTTCVIMLSEGFADPLATHIGDDAGFGDDEQADLCPDDDDPVVFEDAFEGQNAGSGQAGGGGGFSSTVSWVRLAPMADGVRDAALDGAEDDELCLTGVFSTQEGVVGTGGVSTTQTTVELGDEFTETYYRDCDVLTSEHTADPSGPHDGTPEDDTYHDASEIWG